MERKAFILALGLVVIAAAGGVGYIQAKRVDLERQVETLRAEAAQQALRIERAEQQAAQAPLKADKAQTAPEDKPTCIDSDTKYGADAIYIRGSVRSASAIVSDHCRLDQLVEFSCIENPHGSGRFIPDATIQNCPSGSRCVAGECLR